MERAIWQVMVRCQTFPWGVDPRRATAGQFAWVFLNHEIDYDERLRKIHTHCLPKFHRSYCEVCHEPIVDERELPPSIREKIYRPQQGEAYNVEVEFPRKDESFGGNFMQAESIDIEIDE